MGEPVKSVNTSRRNTTVDAAYDSFMNSRYWPSLDGLRALSIVLVLTAHTHDDLWKAFDGSLGVTLFFVISGFLITSLSLREEARNGHLSLRAFYIKRVFRIVPLYFLALGTFSFLVLVLGLGQGGDALLQRLPLLATFNGEFAGTGTFSHSWSLGIEEKFYILWPLLAFGSVALRKHRAAMLTVLVPAAAVASFVPQVGYFGIYFPILGGCAMAVAANNRRTFPAVYALARPVPAALLFGLMVLGLIFDRSIPFPEAIGYAHTVFSVAALLALPGILIGDTPIRQFFALPRVAHYGTLAYAVYLFHPLCIEAVGLAIPSGTGVIWQELVRFVAVFVSSYILAEILFRAFERPCIQYGRALAVRSRTDKDRVIEPQPAQ